MVTMKDVARAAGVSQATVSYVYSGSGRVSAGQREQILAVAAELGYTGPNIAGSSLRLGRIGTVGVLVPGSLATAVEDPSTTLLLRGIVEVGELADVALTLLPVARTGAPNPVQPAALRGLVDGVVMHCLPDDHPVVGAVLSRRIPAVAIDSPRLPNIPYVTIDHRQAGADQMEHVLALGHRRIGVIADRLGPVAAAGTRDLPDRDSITETYLQQRLAGYRDAIAGPRGVHVHLAQARARERVV
ncbi:LacI family DNA-binding transcriptional regulator [Mycobacterium sp. NPDC003449]